MLRHLISMVAGLFATNNKVQTMKATTYMVPSFYIPKGSFEGAQEMRRKNRRNKIVRRNRDR